MILNTVRHHFDALFVIFIYFKKLLQSTFILLEFENYNFTALVDSDTKVTFMFQRGVGSKEMVQLKMAKSLREIANVLDKEVGSASSSSSSSSTWSNLHNTTWCSGWAGTLTSSTARFQVLPPHITMMPTVSRQVDAREEGSGSRKGFKQ